MKNNNDFKSIVKGNTGKQANTNTAPSKPQTLIAIPTLGTLPVDFVISLMALRKPSTQIMFSKTTILPQARDNFANIAINNGYKYILFIDSDMTFPADAYEKLLAHDVDIVTSLCFARRGIHEPCIYKDILYKDSDAEAGKRLIIEEDYNRDFFEIKGCGMAFCLIKTQVLIDICKKFEGTLFKYWTTFGEDLSFCIRALECGYKIYCDGTIPMGHIGEETFTKAHYETYKQMVANGMIKPAQ